MSLPNSGFSDTFLNLTKVKFFKLPQFLQRQLLYTGRIIKFPASAEAINYIIYSPMTSKHTKIKFPLWQYLNQPLFNRDIQLVWSPQRFAILWRIELLERCWSKKCASKGKQQS